MSLLLLFRRVGDAPPPPVVTLSAPRQHALDILPSRLPSLGVARRINSSGAVRRGNTKGH